MRRSLGKLAATSMNGDLNGDGLEDIAISAPHFNSLGPSSDNGKVYVIFGAKGGSGLVMDRPLANHNASFLGENNNDMAAESLDMAGDINGDGYDDLLIGVWHYGTTGQVYIVFGKATGWSKNVSLGSVDASYLGENSGDSLSKAVSVGDINGDGLDDLVMGADSSAVNGTGSGKVYIIFGHKSGWSMDTALSDATADASIIGEGANERFGSFISAAGDVNGDGLDDFLVGTTTHKQLGDTFTVGKSYLMLGRRSGWKDGMTVSDMNASWYGDYPEGWCGYVSAAGDVDTDGFDDILIGCPNNGQNGLDYGKVYLIYGKAAGWARNQNISTADASFIAEATQNRLGLSETRLGDVNGDGFADFALGAPLYNSNVGKAYLFLGKAIRYGKDTLVSTASSSFVGEASPDTAHHLAGGGDVDGDGTDDMVISAQENDQSFLNAGQTYLLYPDHNWLPSSVSSIKAMKSIGCTPEVFTALVNDTVCIELKGTDTNASRNDVALVKVHNPSKPKSDFTMRLYETGKATGTFWGMLTIKDRTRKSDNWVGAALGNYVIVSDLKDPTKNATILVDEIPIQLRPLQDTKTINEDAVYSVQYQAVGKNAPSAWTFTSSASWLSWGPTNHTVYGVPTNAHVGNSWVRINVTDGLGNFDEHNFTLTVKNTPPVILTTDVTSAVQDNLYRVDYNSTDDGQGPITWSWTTNASAWLNFNTTTGVLSGTPQNQHVGTYRVNVSVNDGHGGTDNHAFNITIGGVNDPPIITTLDVKTILEDENYNVTYFALDPDVGDTITWTLKTNASWLHLNVSSRQLWGVPLNKDVGVWWVNITAKDTVGAKDSHNFTITVLNVNDPPTIISTPVNTTKVLYRYKYQVIAQDIDKGDSLKYCFAQPPAGMTIDANTGLIDWLPTREQRGVNFVEIEVYDTNNSMANQSFNITVEVPSATLLAPKDGSVVNNMTPEFLWTLPYNGNESIIYDVYLEQGPVPLTILVEGINTTNFTVKLPLKDNADYSWFVLPRTGAVRADPSDIWHFHTDSGFVPMPKISLDLDRGDLLTDRGRNITVRGR
jgi:hypothetical protein